MNIHVPKQDMEDIPVTNNLKASNNSKEKTQMAFAKLLELKHHHLENEGD